MPLPARGKTQAGDQMGGQEQQDEAIGESVQDIGTRS